MPGVHYIPVSSKPVGQSQGHAPGYPQSQYPFKKRRWRVIRTEKRNSASYVGADLADLGSDLGNSLKIKAEGLNYGAYEGPRMIFSGMKKRV